MLFPFFLPLVGGQGPSAQPFHPLSVVGSLGQSNYRLGTAEWPGLRFPGGVSVPRGPADGPSPWTGRFLPLPEDDRVGWQWAGGGLGLVEQQSPGLCSFHEPQAGGARKRAGSGLWEQ